MVMSSFSRPLLRQVGVGELLVLDALLDVLIVEVELLDAVVGAEAGVVVGDDGLEGLLLGLGLVLVVFLLLRQIFLNLPHVGADVGGRGEDAAMLSGTKLGSAFCLSAWAHSKIS